MKILQLYRNGTQNLDNLKDLPPLFFRLILAYGFYTPAMMKWENILELLITHSAISPTINHYDY